MTPQNPIQKAHLEGIKLFDKEFPALKSAGHKKIHWHASSHEGQACDYRCTYVGEAIKSFLTTYAESILNAALEAGPKRKDDDDGGDFRYDMSFEKGHNSCRLSFRQAIDEGIKEIKKGEV